MTKEEKIDLMMKFIKGEIPASKLKQYKAIMFMYFSDDQFQAVQEIVGPVTRFRSQYMPDGERICGLFEGIPFGFTGFWHLTMVMHQDSFCEVIAGNRPDVFNKFINDLKATHNDY